MADNTLAQLLSEVSLGEEIEAMASPFSMAQGQVGCVALINGEAVGLDCVSSPDVQRGLCAKLIRGYALEAILAPEVLSFYRGVPRRSGCWRIVGRGICRQDLMRQETTSSQNRPRTRGGVACCQGSGRPSFRQASWSVHICCHW